MRGLYNRSHVVARERAALAASYSTGGTSSTFGQGATRWLLLVIIMALAVGAGLMQAFHATTLEGGESASSAISAATARLSFLRAIPLQEDPGAVSTQQATISAGSSHAKPPSVVGDGAAAPPLLAPLRQVPALSAPAPVGIAAPPPALPSTGMVHATREGAVPPLIDTLSPTGSKSEEEFTAPAERYPTWWAWGKDGGSSGSSSTEYQCLALNSEFSPPRIVTEVVPEKGRPGRLRRRLEYGHWRVRWPRFVDQSHADWFGRQNLVGWRRGADGCVGTYDMVRMTARGKREGAAGAGGAASAPSMLNPVPKVVPFYPPGSTPSSGGVGGVVPWKDGEPPHLLGWEAPSDTSDHWLYFCEPRYTVGGVALTDTVAVSEAPGGHDCGPDADLEALVRNGETMGGGGGGGGGGGAQLPLPPDRDLGTPLFWGVIPATWTWQHWCENTLPKMAQVEAGLVWEEVWGKGNPPTGSYPAASSGSGSGGGGLPVVQEHSPRLLARRRDPTTPPPPMWAGMAGNQELLNDRFPIVAAGIYRETLNMTPMDVRNAPLRTTRLVHACRAPPLHPFLWQLGQAKVFALGPHAHPARRRKLVYCSRRDASTTEHPGRLLVNEAAVVALLKAKCAGSEAAGGVPCSGVVTFNHKAFNNSVGAIGEYFSDAIGLVSPHGGCLTNVNLLPCNAGVLEIMPHRPNGEPTEPHWHMLYMQAVFLEMRYWMLPVAAAEGTRDDMNVPLDHLGRILDGMLSLPPTKT